MTPWTFRNKTIKNPIIINVTQSPSTTDISTTAVNKERTTNLIQKTAAKATQLKQLNRTPSRTCIQILRTCIVYTTIPFINITIAHPTVSPINRIGDAYSDTDREKRRKKNNRRLHR